MSNLEKMPGHTRLYRRVATYYHRAAVPQDIFDTYRKREETFSLRTIDHAEAVKKVRIDAVRVHALFDAHRKKVSAERLVAAQPALEELSAEQIKRAKQAYLHHLLDEDEEVRLDGFVDLDDLGDPDNLSNWEHDQPSRNTRNADLTSTTSIVPISRVGRKTSSSAPTAVRGPFHRSASSS